MPNTYACKLVTNPNVPIFLPRVCTLVLFIYLCRSKSFDILYGVGLFFILASHSNEHQLLAL